MSGKLPEMDKLCTLMDDGEPVCITFLKSSDGKASDKLYCELVSEARYGKKFHINSQRCGPGDYVLGKSEIPPSEYYLKSGRYQDEEAAENAATNLPRIERKYESIEIVPLSLTKNPFDICILYLKPESAMRIVQAFAYLKGEKNIIDTIGAASVCGDCTARPLESGIGLSFGCKGSRKHSFYPDSEVPLGLHYDLVEQINRALGKLPETRQ
ncbi:uncharacterized protein (DUF169 family) [Methanohalophilus levihalophilus]|uniref:DUF169 domain-containing protein n=1 Tax=Methanohalophilus levihalophilus TaxID=1431282 RepID=UPI001FD931BD|nr:DUF169 domain-containing protein [Methanohalophilus levihalophilus]MBP2031324.1 uncharacterized protein (DUF169 family) [Methanohalophilus levihalophilus]